MKNFENKQMLIILKNSALFIFLLVTLTATCHAKQAVRFSILELGLEALMNIEVTSVSKKKQRLSEASSAVFVIKQEDIRRSGVTSIPEALQLVPGVQVARIDSNKWAVGSRGFFGLSGRFENKLLVLVDGRSVYSPLFSGVFWELQDTLLEDVERIEVIRGPGATLWGANAVNGVINIITKDTADTQGSLVTGIAGTEENRFGLRFGGQNDHASYRLFAKYSKRDSAVYPDGSDGFDDWNSVRTGFRIDTKSLPRDTLSLQGELFKVYAGEKNTISIPSAPFEQTSVAKNKHHGGHLLGRWKRTVSDSSELELQLYYDNTAYNTNYVETSFDTLDIDFQYRSTPYDRHELLWGVGYRLIIDSISNTYSLSLLPTDDSYQILSAFIQDDITIFPNKFNLIIGSKLEHNDFTGFEIQPNIRLIWQIDERQSIWGSISRAVRTPSRGEKDNSIRQPIRSPSPPLNQYTQAVYNGSKDIGSEEIIGYELGYRVQPADNFSLDLAMFFNQYEDVRHGVYEQPYMENSQELGKPILKIPIIVNNDFYGDTFGVEVAADWRIQDWWHLKAAYSYLTMNVKSYSDSTIINLQDLDDRSPKHQLSLRSSMDLLDNLELDLWARYTGKIRGIDGNNIPSGIDDYITLDARLGYHPTANVEISLIGKNLLNDHHLEFVPEIFQLFPTEIERSVFAKFTYNF